MPAAYDAEGRLKKHALRGTSLASDPNRAKERGSFKELHNEAVAQNLTRDQMSEKLTDRYKNYNQDQQRSLADIARKKQIGEDKYRGLANEELNADFQRYNDGQRSAEFDTRTANEYRDSGKQISTKMKNASKEEGARWIDYAAKKDKNIWSEKKYKKWAKKQNKKGLAAIRKEQWTQRAGQAAQNREENRLNAEIADINKTYIPLEQNQAQREARLRSRMELYNMFLGE